MIPKTIHYCWFGRNPKPKLLQKCIKSWKKKCPDYEIIEWNEDNFDISTCPLYVRQAYEAKKWAYATDYIRLQVVYEHGGVYLDTDVELLKSLDPFLEYESYFGFEEGTYINTGLGFGAVAGTLILWEMMQDYQDTPFILPDGSYDIATTCPLRNTGAFLRHGLQQNDERQLLMDGSVLVLPTAVLCPISYTTRKKNVTKETVSIHHFTESGLSADQRRKQQECIRAVRRIECVHSLVHLPNRILKKMLGDRRYAKLKQKLKKN